MMSFTPLSILDLAPVLTTEQYQLLLQAAGGEELVPAYCAALADKARFTRSAASAPDKAGNVDLTFTIAGLGDNVTFTVAASADASVVYACCNTGGNFPNDPKKTEVSAPVSTSGQLAPGKNGQVAGSLTFSPPPTTLTCPPGQRRVLVGVSYTSVQLSGAGDTASIPGTFGRTFVDI